MQTKIENILTPVINNLGYDLWGIEYFPQTKNKILRIYIDHVNGISLTDCEAVSKVVSAHLDVENLIQEHYTLEISSPGIPRKIFYWTQYQKYLGKELQLKLYQTTSGTKNFVGTLHAVQENSLMIEREDVIYNFSKDQIVKAYVIEHI